MSAAESAPPDSDWLATDAAHAAARTRTRRANAVTDLFMPPADRLRDDDRAAIARLLGALVDGIEQALRARLAMAAVDRPMLAAALAAERVPIARPILEDSGALRDADLIAVLTRRSMAARVAIRLRSAAERAAMLDPDEPVSSYSALREDGDGAIAAAATRLDAAERDRRDASGMPLPAAAELPAEVQHQLVWRIAAALRDHVAQHHAAGLATLDPAIAAAAGAVLAGYDEGETLPALALALARALDAAARLDEGLIGDALAAGHVGFAVAALAARAGICFEAAWDMALDPAGAGLLPLCRAADLTPAAAAMLALALDPDGDDDLLADRIDIYRATPRAQAAAAVALWRLDPAYRDAIAALDRGAAR